MAALPNDLLHGSVEKLKCILRLLPIWLYTIIYSMVFTQMASLFVEQGDAVGNKGGKLQNPSRKYVKLQHLQRGGVHLPVQKTTRSTCGQDNEEQPGRLKMKMSIQEICPTLKV